MENVQKALKRFPSHLLAAVQSDIHDLHSTRTQASFLQMRDAVLRKWMEDSRLLAFSQYMSAQWLYGPFSKWQAYATPIGFATTNDPVETFNAVIKRDYTLRRRLKIGTLLRELSACCQDQSLSTPSFQFGVTPRHRSHAV
ncbi:hypothetical protein PPTG_22120 [Phytophthora nicotianae INRA-310]|uniref:Uncharacterized protein n=1 Tax=Phytophthora nicotianae (strain INRA-310) TaxID=761204 RepID=W2QPJ1_PHYN3|nr:hypothetical protein PPTG_22120 [Phytophthora nicotianae INRA-310]ETN14419.1 hypothetical protein PPTG_22120 [Phytophthora nicotianae INRA-310]